MDTTHSDLEQLSPFQLKDLDAPAYEAIGRDLTSMARQAVEEWAHARRSGR